MNAKQNSAFKQLSWQFLQQNYDYVWLHTMLRKANSVSANNATLITGSSLALNGIQENLWKNATNCSMHSQDFYYDFLCARKVITSASIGRRFKRCFIVVAYYNAYSDLSRSTIYRTNWIPRIYAPIFQDTHNWKDPDKYELWSAFEAVPEKVRLDCEKIAEKEMLKLGTYYNSLRKRGSIFDLKGRKWWELTEEERLSLGIMRSEGHNKGFQRYCESAEENQEILNDYVHFLHLHDIMPILVIPPLTPVYKQYVKREIRDNMIQMVDRVPEDVHYVDFNDGSIFGPEDFVDTDHLSEKGARKMSAILVEMFGA